MTGAREVLKKLENMLLAALLRRMPVEGMDSVVFNEIAKKIVITTVNLVVLRRENGVLKVLLTRRPDDDICWPGMWHVPGTAIRQTDDPGNPIGTGDPMKRLLQKELGASLRKDPILVEERYLHPKKRGPEISRLFLGEIEGNPKIGNFHDVQCLPKNIIQGQISWIRAAETRYRWIEQFF